MRKDNTSGFTGVFRSGDKWRARIVISGTPVDLGVYDTIDDAISARNRVKKDKPKSRRWRSRSNNTSGFTGVMRLGDGLYGCRRYRARIMVAGELIELGVHATIEAAILARLTAEKKYGRR